MPLSAQWDAVTTTTFAVFNLGWGYFTIFSVPNGLAANATLVKSVAAFQWGLGSLQALPFLLTGSMTSYGKFADDAAGGRAIAGNLAWWTMEQPSFFVALAYVLFTLKKEEKLPPGAAFLAMFMLHYFHRSFIYPWSTRSRPWSLVNWVGAVVFTSWNGAFQANDLFYGGHYSDWSVVTSPRALVGYSVFLFGMATNIHSDYTMRTLRSGKPGDLEYKIPRGGMFEYISGANLWGECVEWTGYAIASYPSWAAFTFAAFNWLGIGCRCIATHRWYKEKFGDKYPAGRKRLIPFIW